ncbi:TetR/AcrR family transcriptional regulator [Siccirubricoccus sp. KC 17139]|uniref:TetR/AcrR family transcriptional regulator n=1 Tax=Siccirubricoccus soli TaxID=2899147 RepID=A0ABT1D3N9_9PROT|nr:TetR/AcrR family transcriptional regulator [Siccirubricoccus soli]MCO6416536.1 TetR/AcrR family transcriptional regulator [Siccirubricoccus soli]MCP2682671.1 TetR/AcrR family transcriptional regulator [Siccirubricoccus soli]
MGASPKQRKRLGRPDAQASEALDRHILETAARLLIEQGYAATSIEQIAVAGRVGKQSIYRRYGSKEGIFKAVLNDLAKPLMDLVDRANVESEDPLADLREVLSLTLETASRPDAAEMYRILTAEAKRFPAFIDDVHDGLSVPIHRMIVRLLGAARAAGQLRSDGDDEMTAMVLRGMITGWTLQESLKGRLGLSDRKEREAFFARAWDIFLKGASQP